MTFRFRRNGGAAAAHGPLDRPIIPVWIGPQEGRRKPFLGLLDTGSDDTVLPIAMASYLGVALDRTTPTYFQGIGGSTVGFYGEVCLELRQSPKAYVWTSRIAFVIDADDELKRAPLVTLGHRGFFRSFNVLFDFQRARVKLWPNSLFVGRAR